MSTLQQWNDSAERFSQKIDEEGDKLSDQIIKPAILKIIGSAFNKKILDSGCGNGYFAAELAKHAKSVIGADFSKNFIDLCKEKYKEYKNLSFIRHDIRTKLPFADSDFDIVISKMVLQYVDRINVFSKENFRVLANAGKLIIAIDHPFHAQYYFAQRQAGKSNPKYLDLKDYFSKGPSKRISLWGKVKLTWYPRTVSEYVNTFIKDGFKLLKMTELPDEEDGVIVPRILILAFQKP